jgi:hypothetical protein
VRDVFEHETYSLERESLPETLLSTASQCGGMPRSGPSRPSHVLLVGVLVVAVVVAPAATVQANPSPAGGPSPASTQSTTVAGLPVHPDGCFPADGAAFVVGSEGPQLRFTLHLSLLRAVITAENGSETAPGAFGIEATATTDGSRVVSLRTGVLFAGVNDAVFFARNPFAAFALAFDYQFSIPAFEGTTVDSAYETSDVPVEGPVEEAACSG